MEKQLSNMPDDNTHGHTNHQQPKEFACCLACSLPERTTTTNHVSCLSLLKARGKRYDTFAKPQNVSFYIHTRQNSKKLLNFLHFISVNSQKNQDIIYHCYAHYVCLHIYNYVYIGNIGFKPPSP